MKKTIIAALLVIAPFAAFADGTNLSGNANVTGYTGSFNAQTSTLSQGGTWASSGGNNDGSSGQETQLKTSGTSQAGGSFGQGGISTNSSFTGDTMSQTFGLQTTGNGWAQSSGSGGTTGVAATQGNFTQAGLGVSGNLTTSGNFGKTNFGSGFGRN